MIRRFLAFLRRTRKGLAPTRLTFTPTPLCRVQTDLTDTVALHTGDLLTVEQGHTGFHVDALVLREWKLQTWVLFHCQTLREAYDLRDVLERALKDGAVRCNPRAALQGELARRAYHEEGVL